jgi:hypothetical protein
MAILGLNQSDFFDVWTEDLKLFVDGNDILNNIGTVCPPRNLILEFVITASPSVLGDETLGFGKGPVHGFTLYLSDLSCVTALIILVERGHLKSELEGDWKLTFSAARSSSALISSSIVNPFRDAAVIISSIVGVVISSPCAQNRPN